MLTPSFVSSIEPPTAIHEVVTTDELTKRIQACNQGKFTGRLDLTIKDTKAQQWSLYFHQGGLIWGTSDIHPIRRWYRQLALYCPQLASKVHASLVHTGATTHHLATAPQQFLESKYMDYDSLVELTIQGKVAHKEIKTVIEGSIAEILFDIHQRWERLRYRSGLELTYRPVSEDALRPTLAVIPVAPIWQRVLQDWEIWRQAGLVDCFPNRAPVIWKAEELQQHTSPLAYQNLSRLVDGHQTLRDLAIQLKQNLLPLTESLMPFIRKGLMGLLDVEDFQVSVKPSIAISHEPAPVTFPTNPIPPKPTSYSIACIDDSKIDTLAMNQILTQAGYQFISIHDPVKALPTLLEFKPDLIFLDLVMPIANGYEICAQIRRISLFKDTPVIILTSSDGIVNRVRAKMVGSSGFLAKPITSEKILPLLQKYLGIMRYEL